MVEIMQVRIMLLVGSNGKVSACVENQLGWGDLADNIMNWPEDGQPNDPDATARYFVDVDVPVPSIEPIDGKLVEA